MKITHFRLILGLTYLLLKVKVDNISEDITWDFSIIIDIFLNISFISSIFSNASNFQNGSRTKLLRKCLTEKRIPVPIH